MTDLYHIQEKVVKQVFESLDGALRCGDTALARCYLQHCISYDLNFFMNSRFDPQLLLNQLNKDAAIKIEEVAIDQPDGIAVQIHGMTSVDGLPLKISFIEDAPNYPDRGGALDGSCERLESEGSGLAESGE